MKEEWLKKGYVDEPVDKLKSRDRQAPQGKECRNTGAFLPGGRNTGNCRFHWRQPCACTMGSKDRCRDNSNVRCPFHGRNRKDTVSRQESSHTGFQRRLFVSRQLSCRQVCRVR